MITETFAVGNQQVSVTLNVDLPSGGETILTGDIGGLVAAGTVARLRGACRLTADLHVRGTLLCDPTGVDLDGQNLYDIHTHDGTLNLVGVEKSAWVRWGDPVVGWQVGDRLGVTPTKVGTYTVQFTTWTGDWATLLRPVNSPDVTLVDRVAKPEVVNLSQTVTLRSLKRIMVHEATVPNPQTFKWIRLSDCGEVAVFDMYPIHFHQIYDHARGSMLQGVVVEGGKNHAFVPHASHGITYLDCAAVNTINDAWWWNVPPNVPSGQPYNPVNDSHDITWQHCLAAGVVQTPSTSIDHGFSAFVIGAGNGNRCIDSVATAVRGTGLNISGFRWREDFVWEFTGCVAHNVQKNGIYTWTNSPNRHPIENFVAYHFGRAGIEHGAYKNQFIYRDCSLTVTNPIFSFSSKDTQAIRQHANSRDAGLLFENIVTDDRLVVDAHGLPGNTPTVHRNCRYTRVVYTEGDDNPSHIRFEDCDLAPADFQFTHIRPESTIEIVEGGVLVYRWAGGWL